MKPKKILAFLVICHLVQIRFAAPAMEGPDDEAPQYVDSNQHSVVFKPTGTFSARTTYLNVRFPVYFQPILDTMQYFKEKILHFPETEKMGAFYGAIRMIQKQFGATLGLTQQQFKGVVSTLPQYQVTPNHKSERFIGFLLGICGMAMAGAETIQIQHLDARIAKGEKETMLLKDITHLHENHLKNLDAKVSFHDQLFRDMIHHNPATFVSTFSAVQRELENKVQMATSLIAHAQAHRLAPGVFNKEALDSVVQYTKKLAKEQQLENFIHHTSDLYQLETSYLYNPENKTFSIILHIPLVQKENLLKMYKFVPLPLNTQLTSNHSLMPDVGNRDIIAVRGTEAYKVLSHSDLHKCLKMGNTHFCRNSNVLSTNMKATCLSSIFMADTLSARDQCKFQVRPRQEAVFETAHNQFIIYTNQTMEIQEVCDTTRKTHTVSSGETVKVGPGCRIKTKEHLLVADLEETFSVEDKEATKSWAWSVGDLFPEIPKDKFNLTLERLNSQGFHTVDATDLLHQLDIIFAQPEPELYKWGYYATGAIFLLLIGILAIWISKCCQKGRQSAKNAASDSAQQHHSKVTKLAKVVETGLLFA